MLLLLQGGVIGDGTPAVVPETGKGGAWARMYDTRTGKEIDMLRLEEDDELLLLLSKL